MYLPDNIPCDRQRIFDQIALPVFVVSLAARCVGKHFVRFLDFPEAHQGHPETGFCRGDTVQPFFGKQP